ncbi:FecR domain-containing protein [Mesorhizobium sp. KR9-304]|uniref:FecR family protein n=1 Tax=Mesorhizobium sp. KR9-304 TaxID=3156614 RepID=UPI0032B55723
MSWVVRGIVVAALFAFADMSVFAAEQVGEAVLIKTTVTGDRGTLATRSPVHRDERIRTSSSGLGEFVFRDGTKFAVGGNSSVVIDKFVFAGSDSVKSLTINAAKGSFRWISGGSQSSAYKIQTPAGTIGIRGTALDIFVGAGGKTAVVLLSGQARFCGGNGCQELKRRCDVVVATPGGGVTPPERVDTGIFRDLGTPRALPFISGHQRLSGRFRVGSGCQLAASLQRSQSPAPQNQTAPSAPNPPDPPDPVDPPDQPSPKQGNNGKGNGGDDGSPNDRGDSDR